MAIGDLIAVDGCPDLHYVDTGMYGVAKYGTVYVLDAERPAIVDAGLGTSTDLILDAMDAVGIAPEDLAVIALTHIHLDHAGGAGLLAETCPNATVAVHEIGAPHIVDPERLVEGTKRAVGDQWQYYVEPEPVPEDRIRELTDGDVIDLGTHRLRVHHAPGHAPHQVIFEDPTNDVVFTADAAGLYVQDRDTVMESTPPSNFDLEKSLADIELVQELDPGVLCFGHFGATETGDHLATYASVLEEWVEAVARKRAEFEDDEAVAEYFAEQPGPAEAWGERKARAEAKLNTRGVLAYLDHRDETDA
jgi:glyoxylase-like metal-dependent hydrolase (beta-lactamase superfamily II)